MIDLDQVEKRAWRLYKSLMKEKYYSPALKKHIRFSNQGWRHLSNHARPTKRTLADLLHRFSLLELATVIIESTTSVRTYRQHNRTFHSLQSVISERVIRVVLIEDLAGNIVFLSVIDKT